LLGKDALGLGDVAQALGVDLLQLGLPELPPRCGQSTSPLGPSESWNASGPPRIAMCVPAEAVRYAALPSAGLVRERPRPPWRRGRVT
jgi:hypothetical protein